MKKILLLTVHFLPYTDANVNCLSELAYGLVKRGYAVSVLTFSFSPTLPAVEDINGITVYRVPVWECEKIDAWLARPAGKLLQAVKSAVSVLLFKCLHRIRRRRAVRFYNAKLKNEAFSYILSSSNPPDPHYIAYRLRGGSFKWILYTLDPFIYQSTSGVVRWQNRKTEKRWCKKADGWIRMECHKNISGQGKYVDDGTIRVLYSHLPNMIVPETECRQTPVPHGDKIVLRYTGMFYEDIRRPDELLRFLDKLDAEAFTAEFYGPCCAYLRAHFDALPACVQLKGTVSAEKCRRLTEEADVLINVGNASVDQVPSKVLEYIATGKPILHFPNTDHDPALLYLERYPRILTLRKADDGSASDVRRLYEQGTVPTADIRSLYSTYLKENVIQDTINFIEGI